MTAPPLRILPALRPGNAHFWQGGAEGELRFLRCASCRTWIHPPSPRCPECLGEELAPEAVSGRGTVVSFTVNHKAWVPGEHEPYAIVLVELEEGIRHQLLLDVQGQLERRHLQQLERLLQTRRHHQLQGLLLRESKSEFHARSRGSRRSLRA